MRTLKHRIQGFSKKVRNLFQPYLSEDIVDAYQPGLDKLIRVLQDGGDYMANEMRMAKGQGEMEINENGVKRESNKGRGRFDLIPYEALEELAKWYEAGAEKYGDRNWEKGISVKDCMNRMARHSAKACNGWLDEGPFAHLAAVIWNAMAAITGIKRNPYTNDHFRDEYLKELGLTDKPDFKQFDSAAFIDGFEKCLLDHMPSHSLAQKCSWEHDKPRLITDKAEEINVSQLGTGLFISCQFKNPADLEEFQANLALIGIENSGGDHDIPTDGGFFRDDGKDKEEKKS